MHPVHLLVEREPPDVVRVRQGDEDLARLLFLREGVAVAVLEKEHLFVPWVEAKILVAAENRSKKVHVELGVVRVEVLRSSKDKLAKLVGTEEQMMFVFHLVSHITTENVPV